MQAHETSVRGIVGRHARTWLLIGLLLVAPAIRTAVAVVHSNGARAAHLTAVTTVLDDAVQPATVRTRTAVAAADRPLDETAVWTIAAAIAALTVAAMRIIRSAAVRHVTTRRRTSVETRLRAPPISRP